MRAFTLQSDIKTCCKKYIEGCFAWFRVHLRSWGMPCVRRCCCPANHVSEQLVVTPNILQAVGQFLSEPGTQALYKQALSSIHSHASLPTCLGNKERRRGGGGQWDQHWWRAGRQYQRHRSSGGIQVSLWKKCAFIGTLAFERKCDLVQWSTSVVRL